MVVLIVGGSLREHRLAGREKSRDSFLPAFPDDSGPDPEFLSGAFHVSEPQSKIPLRDLCGLCAMLSQLRLFLRPEADGVTDRILWSPNPKSPLCDLCGLRAMLSQIALVSRPEATVSV